MNGGGRGKGKRKEKDNGKWGRRENVTLDNEPLSDVHGGGMVPCNQPGPKDPNPSERKRNRRGRNLPSAQN